MIYLDKDCPVLIYRQCVDMRKSIDGLSLLVIEELQLNPQAKAMYLFRNRSNNKFKAIVWDGDGFILLYKRKEQGRFQFPRQMTDAVYEIDADLFIWLRKGFDFYALTHHPDLKVSQYY